MTFKHTLIATAALLLTACGGGGDAPQSDLNDPAPGDTSPQPTLTLETPQLVVAAPIYSNTARLDAFNMLNEIRTQAGLGLLAQNTMLDQASQAHADWQVANDTMSHYEVAGTPGFTGVTVGDRMRAAGYYASLGAEVIAYNLATDTGADAIVRLTDKIYHRIFVLEPTVKDMGIGVNMAGEPLPVNVKVATPSSSNGQGIPNGGDAVVWPKNGATGVKIAMGPESSNPIPDISEYAVGYPASIHCPTGKTLNVTSFTMHDSEGTSVDAALRHWTVDPNNIFQKMKCAAGLVPRAHLKRGSTYKISFVGNIDGTPVQKSWQFTTVN